MLTTTLKEIKSNSGFMSLYTTGMSNLWQSGVLKFLRERGRCFIKVTGNDSTDLMTGAAWSAGFQDCLDMLEGFREIFLDSEERVRPIMNFGSVDNAVKHDDLLPEEIDAVRTGKPVDYEAVVRSRNKSTT